MFLSMNFSRLAPSPPFPSPQLPGHTPRLGDHCWGLHWPLLKSLLHKSRAVCRRGCLCMGSFLLSGEKPLLFQGRWFPVAPEAQLEGRGWVQALFQRAECSPLPTTQFLGYFTHKYSRSWWGYITSALPGIVSDFFHTIL